MSSVPADTQAHAGHAEHADTASFLKTYVFSLDHKIIGLQFLFSTLIWFVVGGLLALGIRWQLAYPWRSMPLLGEMVAQTEGGQIAPPEGPGFGVDLLDTVFDRPDAVCRRSQ